MSTYPSVYRRYQSVEQATAVLSLLGYEQRHNGEGKLLPREWGSKTSRPARVRLDVGSSYPHRVIVRKGSK